MAFRKHILAAILIISFLQMRSQSLSFQQADSASYVRYQAGQWQELLNFSNNAIARGVDYPILRLRMAYAHFVLGNYSGALAQYGHVLSSDSHNQMACYYSYLCNKYLNRDTEASFHAGFVDSLTLNKEEIKPFGALQAGLETGVKTPSNKYRGSGSYTRAFLSNRLGWRFQLDQSVAYFGQTITNPTATTTGGPPGSTPVTMNSSFSDSQFEYYLKLTYAVTGQLNLLGAYHFLNTSYGLTSGFQNHVGFAGLRFSAPYFSLQADASLSNINSSHLQQYNATLTFYPLGNLNLYAVTRISAQTGGVKQTVFNQLVGLKVAKIFWVELSGYAGHLDSYLDADALYVYNAFDLTQFKTGSTFFFPAGKHAVIFANYTFEQKQDFYLNTNYNQHSITGGLTWKF